LRIFRIFRYPPSGRTMPDLDDHARPYGPGSGKVDRMNDEKER